MAWVAVNKEGFELLFKKQPRKSEGRYEVWYESVWGILTKLPFGKKLTWDDEPVELKEEPEWVEFGTIKIPNEGSEKGIQTGFN